MFSSTVYFAFGFLGFLPCTQALICGDTNICFPDDDQVAYCCGYDATQCCYYSDYSSDARPWWVWFLIVLFVVSFWTCIISLCCYCFRCRQRMGYVIVPGQTAAPTVIQSHVAQTHVAAPHPQYYNAGDPVQQGGYHPKEPSAPSNGNPPPYAPSQLPAYQGY